MISVGAAHQETTLLTRSKIIFMSPSTCRRDMEEFARFSLLSSIWMSFSFMRSLLQFPVESSHNQLPTAIMRSEFLSASLALVCHPNPNTHLYRGFEKSAQRFPIGPVIMEALTSSAKFVIALIAHPPHPCPRYNTIFLSFAFFSSSISIVMPSSSIFNIFLRIEFGRLLLCISLAEAIKTSEGMLKCAGPGFALMA